MEGAVAPRLRDLVFLVKGVHPASEGQVPPFQAPSAVRRINAAPMTHEKGEVTAPVPPADAFAPGNLVQHVLAPEREIEQTSQQAVG